MSRKILVSAIYFTPIVVSSTFNFKVVVLLLLPIICCCVRVFGFFGPIVFLPVEFLLVRYSILFTVESLSLLYLLVIALSWFICFRK